MPDLNLLFKKTEYSLKKDGIGITAKRAVNKVSSVFFKKNLFQVPSMYDMLTDLPEAEHRIVFCLPSMNISGGVLVALKHAEILKEAGYDVVITSLEPGEKVYRNGAVRIPVLYGDARCINVPVEKAVATFWNTVPSVEECAQALEKYYLVQNYETDFYPEGSPFRNQAEKTYSGTLAYITISRWCQDWLQKKYGQNTAYAPNGIDISSFRFRERTMTGKIRVLIEGDCASAYKNVDESFQVANRLDRSRFEIWYMSYNGKPKSWYRFDRFLHKVPHEQVHEIYEQCDLLLKSSLLESFSYPPLEMMATGGFAVVAKNEGNAEYLRDGENCLTYEAGDPEAAAAAIERLCNDARLREQIAKGGLETAKSRDWNNVKGEILNLYHA